MNSEVAAAFDSTPQGYGTGGDFHARYAGALVDHARLQPGQSVLDIATGTGPAAIAAAEAVGSSGQVTGVDISVGMLAQARRNVASQRAGSVRLMEADGARLPFEDGTFDFVLCSSSIVWFPDIHGALVEWRRVLRPGGRLAFSCLAASALPLGELFRTHLRAFGVDFPDLNEPLDIPEKCRRTAHDAGFGRVAVHLSQFGATLATVDEAVAAGTLPLAPDPNGDEAWRARVQQPVSLWARVRRGLPIPVPLTPTQLTRLDQGFRAEVSQLMTDHGIPNPVTALFVVADR